MHLFHFVNGNEWRMQMKQMLIIEEEEKKVHNDAVETISSDVWSMPNTLYQSKCVVGNGILRWIICENNWKSVDPLTNELKFILFHLKKTVGYKPVSISLTLS